MLLAQSPLPLLCHRVTGKYPLSEVGAINYLRSERSVMSVLRLLPLTATEGLLPLIVTKRLQYCDIETTFSLSRLTDQSELPAQSPLLLKVCDVPSISTSTRQIWLEKKRKEKKRNERHRCDYHDNRTVLKTVPHVLYIDMAKQTDRN